MLELSSSPGGPEDSTDRRRRGLRKSVGDKVRSLAVIVVIVAGIVLAVPRPSSISHRAVDVEAATQGMGAALGFTPALPSGLPARWTATSVYVSDSGEGILTWHVGYLTTDGHYASVEQAAKVTGRWEEILTSGGTAKDAQMIDGTTWEQRFKDVRDVYSLIHRGESRTTLVTSKGGGLANAAVLARSIPVSLR